MERFGSYNDIYHCNTPEDSSIRYNTITSSEQFKQRRLQFDIQSRNGNESFYINENYEVEEYPPHRRFSEFESPFKPGTCRTFNGYIKWLMVYVINTHGPFHDPKYYAEKAAELIVEDHNMHCDVDILVPLKFNGEIVGSERLDLVAYNGACPEIVIIRKLERQQIEVALREDISTIRTIGNYDCSIIYIIREPSDNNKDYYTNYKYNIYVGNTFGPTFIAPVYMGMSQTDALKDPTNEANAISKRVIDTYNTVINGINQEEIDEEGILTEMQVIERGIIEELKKQGFDIKFSSTDDYSSFGSFDVRTRSDVGTPDFVINDTLMVKFVSDNCSMNMDDRWFTKWNDRMIVDYQYHHTGIPCLVMVMNGEHLITRK